MDILDLTSRKGSDGVRKLRERKLKMGIPFMINAEELASNQCYYEYPDGSIKLTTISHVANEIKIIRELSKEEAAVLRNRFHISAL